MRTEPDLPQADCAKAQRTGHTVAALGRPLAALLLCYAGATLVHFAHNAQYLKAYPNLPSAWSRTEVWLAWLGITALGACGCLLHLAGHQRSGLALLAVYAALGLDSLGHYVVAPFSAHTPGMNLTILVEVGAAAAVLLCVLPLLWRSLARPAGTG